ncbi:MAG: hypothetical protein MJ016_02845 [Victivallaceae bacterium]|nr:hypothetical protein [Victivallaceae bacterium]
MKSFLLLGVLFVSTMLAAAQSVLLDYLPADSEGAVYLDLETIQRLPEVADQLKKPENASVLASYGYNESDARELILFTVSHPVINAALVRVDPQLDPEKKMTDLKISFKKTTVSNLPAWEMVFPDNGGDVVAVRLADGVYLLADDTADALKLTQKKRGNASAVLQQAALLPIQNAPVWLVDTNEKLPVRTKKKDDPDVRGNLRFCLAPIDGVPGFRVRGVIDCPDRSAASQMLMLIQLGTNVVCSALFSEDPDLAQEVMSTISMKVVDSECRIDAEVMRALSEKVYNYLRSRDLRDAVQGADALPAF